MSRMECEMGAGSAFVEKLKPVRVWCQEHAPQAKEFLDLPTPVWATEAVPVYCTVLWQSGRYRQGCSRDESLNRPSLPSFANRSAENGAPANPGILEDYWLSQAFIDGFIEVRLVYSSLETILLLQMAEITEPQIAQHVKLP